MLPASGAACHDTKGLRAALPDLSNTLTLKAILKPASSVTVAGSTTTLSGVGVAMGLGVGVGDNVGIGEGIGVGVGPAADTVLGKLGTLARFQNLTLSNSHTASEIERQWNVIAPAKSLSPDRSGKLSAYR